MKQINQVSSNRSGLQAVSSLSIIFSLLFASSAMAQTADEWQPPRTSAGHPILQGYWTSSTIVPLQRPTELGTQAFYSIQEAAEVQRRALTSGAETVAGTAADVHYQFDDYSLNRSEDTIASNLRTSIITNPANGRLPAVRPEAEARAEEYNTYRREHGYDSAQNRGLSERCLIWSNEGPPMIPLGYNSTLQIIQTPSYVVILLEMIHDVRIIPLRDQHEGAEVLPQWLGNSVGHWEGDTLVIETTGFSGRTMGRGINTEISVDTHVIERISRSEENSLNYQFTIEDPNIWDQSWSGEYPMQSINGPMFEYACHEGNYGIVNILNGVRAEEREALEASN